MTLTALLRGENASPSLFCLVPLEGSIYAQLGFRARHARSRTEDDTWNKKIKGSKSFPFSFCYSICCSFSWETRQHVTASSGSSFSSSPSSSSWPQIQTLLCPPTFSRSKFSLLLLLCSLCSLPPPLLLLSPPRCLPSHRELLPRTTTTKRFQRPTRSLPCLCLPMPCRN